jgi:hypothetical protein
MGQWRDAPDHLVFGGRIPRNSRKMSRALESRDCVGQKAMQSDGAGATRPV